VGTPTTEPRIVTPEEWKQLCDCEQLRGADHRFRKRPRLPVECSAIITGAHSGAVPDTATAMNISFEGMMLRSHVDLQPGTRIRVDLMLEDETIAVEGIVQHSTPSVGCFKIGLKIGA
jgi:PilZ domain